MEIRSAIDDNTAIRMQALPSDETAVLAGQENEAGCDFRGLSRTTHGGFAKRVLGVGFHG